MAPKSWAPGRAAELFHGKDWREGRIGFAAAAVPHVPMARPWPHDLDHPATGDGIHAFREHVRYPFPPKEKERLLPRSLQAAHFNGEALSQHSDTTLMLPFG